MFANERIARTFTGSSEASDAKRPKGQGISPRGQMPKLRKLDAGILPLHE